jgi:hypothetical protein
MVFEVLHHGHALPAWDSILRRKRVKPAASKKRLVVISNTVKAVGFAGLFVRTMLGLGFGVFYLGFGVQVVLEYSRPVILSILVVLEELDSLNSVVVVDILILEDMIALAAAANYVNLIGVQVGVDTFPYLTKRSRTII